MGEDAQDALADAGKPVDPEEAGDDALADVESVRPDQDPGVPKKALIRTWATSHPGWRQKGLIGNSGFDRKTYEKLRKYEDIGFYAM